MNIRQIRNATILLEFGGKRILVDPMLAGKGAYPPFPGTVNSHLMNPLVDLPVPAEELLAVDAVIVTHTHIDHWDEAARRLVPKDMLLFVQNEQDAARIAEAGFRNLRVLTENTDFDGLTLIKTPGQHGSDEAMQKIGDRLGLVCGVVLRHPSEKVLYIAGDTVWNRDVEQNLKTHAPDVVLLNCGDAQIIGCGSIIMNKEDVARVCESAPGAVILASHMEALNHCVLSRSELREFLAERGLTDRVLVPADGESLSFPR